MAGTAALNGVQSHYDIVMGLLSDLGFLMMAFFMWLEDRFTHKIDTRVTTFPIKKGMTVIDYGCGPGRYTIRYASLVGSQGQVYAVDIHHLAITSVEKKAKKAGYDNIRPVLATGNDSGLPDGIADLITAIDMIFGVDEPEELLKELHRLLKEDGILIIDDNHRSRSKTRSLIARSGLWIITEDHPDHITCTPI